MRAYTALHAAYRSHGYDGRRGHPRTQSRHGKHLVKCLITDHQGYLYANSSALQHKHKKRLWKAAASVGLLNHILQERGAWMTTAGIQRSALF